VNGRWCWRLAGIPNLLHDGLKSCANTLGPSVHASVACGAECHSVVSVIRAGIAQSGDVMNVDLCEVRTIFASWNLATVPRSFERDSPNPAQSLDLLGHTSATLRIKNAEGTRLEWNHGASSIMPPAPQFVTIAEVVYGP